MWMKGKSNIRPKVGNEPYISNIVSFKINGRACNKKIVICQRQVNYESILLLCMSSAFGSCFGRFCWNSMFSNHRRIYADVNRWMKSSFLEFIWISCNCDSHFILLVGIWTIWNDVTICVHAFEREILHVNDVIFEFDNSIIIII